MGLALGAVLAAAAIWIAVQTVLQSRNGLIKLDFWGTYPKLAAAKSETSGFWLIAVMRLLIVVAMLYFSYELVRA